MSARLDISDLPWPQRLYESLKHHVDEATAREVVGDHGGLETLEDKARWTKAAVDRLDRAVPDEALRRRIVAACCCGCFKDKIDEVRAEFERGGSRIEDLPQLMHGKFFLNPPEMEGRTIYITKVPFDREGHEQAVTPFQKQRTFCHCEWVKAAEEPVSETYCYCGAGWAGQIFEHILGREVEVEVVLSVLRGDPVCKIAVRV